MTRLVGERIPRKEDRRLLMGAGRYVDDVARPRLAHAAILRSPHAHARLLSLDAARARSAAGVLAVLSGRDWQADGLGGLPQSPNGVDHLDVTKPAFAPECLPHGELRPLPPLVLDRARHVGEAVAIVVAETEAAARDAAELVAVEWQVLPSVTDARAALRADAPRLYDERPDNLCVEGRNGDREAVDRAMGGAARVVRLEAWNHRICGAPMEPRAALGEWDEEAGLYTLHSASQGVHRHKAPLVACLGVAPDRVRVVTGDVGGGFGVRSPCYPEYALVLWAARRVGRPVKWTATRGESFLSDFQARDMHGRGALALHRDGRFLALELDWLGNLGAYPASYAVLANLLRMAGGVYDIPALHVRARGVVTNTVPVGVYRGAGRPEVTFLLERLVDLAAAELGLERAELRRRNLIPAGKLPYRSPLGHIYDSGAFSHNLAAALELVDWAGFPARRKDAARRGRLAGIGLANYLESPTGFPFERTDLSVAPEGKVTAVIGTQASGQGHETSFAQVVAELLQIPLDAVEIAFGDSALAAAGGGSHSDRSMRLGGTVLVRAGEAILAQGRRLASFRLEASERDIAYDGARFVVAGTDRALGLFEAAALALDPATPAELRRPLAAASEVAERLPAHPTGCAACEVEIDPETGSVRIVRYVTVDDVGRVVNPMIVEGQVHGGIAQGLGQALMEASIYDRAGQILSGSFLDYAMPRASDLPPFVTLQSGVPAASNPLGIKGAGECGTTPAAAAFVNAVADALALPHLEMPLTPERLWRAAQGA